MKRIALAVTAALAVAPAFAQYDRYDSNRDWRVEDGRDYRNDSYARDWRARSDDYGRVIEARPLYAADSAKEECFNTRTGRYEEPRDSSGNKVGAGTAIGAVAGGVLGHQVGSGRGNTLATVGGALLGGLAGHHVENRNNNDDGYDRSRCRVTSHNGAAPAGYDVRYEYKGREYVTRLDHDPGRWVRTGSDIGSDGTPLEGRSLPGYYSGG
jgi:uncharacterized protein YcfJ